MMIIGVKSKYNGSPQTQPGGLYNIAQGAENDYHSRRSGKENVKNGRPCACNNQNTTRHALCTTDVWHQVLWGSKQRVQGSNGLKAAQLRCSQGSISIFQHKVGVSCGTGLGHGVTMHPRGRHLRGVMILMSHGLTHPTAREQQPTSPLHRQQLPQLQLLGSMTQCRHWNRRRVNKFPRRDVSQRSCTASLSNEFGELSRAIGPTVNVQRELCDSWLSPCRTRSNLVSSRNGT